MFKKESHESEKDPFAFSISLPNTYEEWRLKLVYYRIDNAHIPMSLSLPDEDNHVAVNFFASLDALKRARVDALYEPILEDGNLSLCSRSQVIDFGI